MRTTYAVSGLTGEHCVRAVRDGLGGLPGVGGPDAVDVDLVVDATSVVQVEAAQEPDHEQVRVALLEAGGYLLL